MTLEIDAHHHFWQLSQPFDYRWLDAPALAPIRRDFLPADLAERPAADADPADDLRPDAARPARESLGAGPRRPARVHRRRRRLGRSGERALRGAVARVPRPPQVRRRPPRHAGRAGRRLHRPPRCPARPARPREARRPVRPAVLRQAPAPRRDAGAALPGLPMVIDHLAKPHIKDGRLDDWLPHLREAAKYPNVYCKLSGMVTEADWRQLDGRATSCPMSGPPSMRSAPERLHVRQRLAGLRAGVFATSDV